MKNNTSPSAKAANVLALSNSWSPTSSITICTVTVVTPSNGWLSNWQPHRRPSQQSVVSPMARNRQQNRADNARQSGGQHGEWSQIGSHQVRQRRRARFAALALITSSDNEEMKGIIIMPMTRPRPMLIPRTGSGRYQRHRAAGATTERQKP